MKRKTAALGLLILLVGVFLVYSPSAMPSFYSSSAVSTTNMVYDRNVAIPVRSSNYSYIKLELSPGDVLSANLQSSSSGINFLLMDEGNFSQFNSNSSVPCSVYTQSKLDISNYTFVLGNVTSTKNFYLVFTDTSQPQPSNSIVLAHLRVLTTGISTEFALIGILVVLLGVVTSVYALIGGRKASGSKRSSIRVPSKASNPAERQVASSPGRCIYCKAPLSQDSVFCPSCKRSQA